MRATGIVVVLGLLLAGQQAEAVKLFIKTTPTVIDTPPHPAFVIETKDIADLDPTDVSKKRHFHFDVTRIDDYWARVTIDAKPGDTFIDNGSLGYLNRYRVVARPGSANRDVVDAKSWVNEGTRYWELKWLGADRRAWTRVDWAYDPADFERGNYGSAHQRLEELARWPAEAAVDRLYLRVITFNVTGETDEARMWLERDGDDVTIHDGVGRAPRATTSTACVVDSPRTVPVDPTFRVYAFDTPRFRVVTTNGEELAARMSPAQDADWRYVWNLAISAPEGATFTVQRLPVAPGCPQTRLLRATRDRSHDEPPEVVGPSASTLTVTVAIADRDTWSAFEVTSRDAATNEPITPTDSFVSGNSANELSIPATSEYMTPRILVTITPLWGDQRGPSWTGWIARPDASGPVTVEAAVQPARRTSVVVNAPLPGPVAAVSPRPDGRGAPVRPVLAIVLLLGLAVTRPRILETWMR